MISHSRDSPAAFNRRFPLPVADPAPALPDRSPLIRRTDGTGNQDSRMPSVPRLARPALRCLGRRRGLDTDIGAVQFQRPCANALDLAQLVHALEGAMLFPI